MLKFKHILKESELNNIETVKNYLEYSFKKRKTKKSLNLYTNLSLIYSTYPDLITEVLDNIPTLGYYKDYFYILYTTKNPEIETYIYNIIITQIKSDVSASIPISTMGKWLPREKSKLNSQNIFIDKFNSLFFPDIKNKITARCEYRKLKTLLNNKLGTLESKLCTRKFDSIEYDKVAPYALKMSMSTILNHVESKQGLSDYKIMMLKKMNIFEFVKELIVGKCMIDTDIVESIWRESGYLSTIPYLENIITNSICITDLSNDMYNIKGEFLAVGITLLVDKYSKSSNKIMVGENRVELDGDIFAKIKQLLYYTGPCKLINYDTESNLIFITPKEIDTSTYLNNILHIKPNTHTYDVIYYENGIKFTSIGNNYITQKNNHNPHKKSILHIINDYPNPMRIINVLKIMWIIFFIIIVYYNM